MFECSGERLPLRVLQLRHAVTELVHESRPPRETGMTWSRDRSRIRKRPPQYAHTWRSRVNSIVLVRPGVCESGRPPLPLMARIDLVASRERVPSRCQPPRNSRTVPPSDHATICLAW